MLCKWACPPHVGRPPRGLLPLPRRTLFSVLGRALPCLSCCLSPVGFRLPPCLLHCLIPPPPCLLLFHGLGGRLDQNDRTAQRCRGDPARCLAVRNTEAPCTPKADARRDAQAHQRVAFHPLQH